MNNDDDVDGDVQFVIADVDGDDEPESAVVSDEVGDTDDVVDIDGFADKFVAKRPTVAKVKPPTHEQLVVMSKSDLRALCDSLKVAGARTTHEMRAALIKRFALQPAPLTRCAVSVFFFLSFFFLTLGKIAARLSATPSRAWPRRWRLCSCHQHRLQARV
jgi:hypothetical protein